MALTPTNPREIRLTLPNGVGHHYNYSRPFDMTGIDLPLNTDYHRKAQEARVIVTIFYSNP